MPPDDERRPRPIQVEGVEQMHSDDSASGTFRRVSGWTICCPICWRKLLPTDGLLSELMPRLAFHLWDEHDLEAAFLRLHLNNPPAEWPELDAA